MMFFLVEIVPRFVMFGFVIACIATALYVITGLGMWLLGVRKNYLRRQS